jgi:DNA-binding NarL/FixJ family response regulator
MTSTNFPSIQDQAKKKILIVDDMPQVRQDLRQLLELTGLFEIVAEAGDGLEAVHQAEKFSPDAIVMDLEMPGVDGYEALHLIKAQNPAIRVIIFSTYAGPEEKKRSYSAGADGFVMKGDRYEILVNAILGKIYSPNSFNTKKG